MVVSSGFLALDEIPARLAASGFNRYGADRVAEELQFAGIVVRDTVGLRLSNLIYARFITAHMATAPGTDTERDAWAAIEQAELALRRAVRDRYASRWQAEADNRMRANLGTESWRKITRNRIRSASSYRYTNHSPDGDVLHYAYFGQLTQLMLARDAWDLFAIVFRDKRELEDITRDVMPVRNDNAHFRTVPERETLRTKLRSDDLLTLLRRHFPNVLTP